MEYNKIVRDKIPEIIAKQGKKVRFKTLMGNELRQALKDKLVEEVQELIKAETKEQIIEEMADVMDVLTAIRYAHSVKYYEVEDARSKKGFEKGRFINGYFLETAEEEEK